MYQHIWPCELLEKQWLLPIRKHPSLFYFFYISYCDRSLFNWRPFLLVDMLTFYIISFWWPWPVDLVPMVMLFYLYNGSIFLVAFNSPGYKTYPRRDESSPWETCKSSIISSLYNYPLNIAWVCRKMFSELHVVLYMLFFVFCKTPVISVNNSKLLLFSGEIERKKYCYQVRTVWHVIKQLLKWLHEIHTQTFQSHSWESGFKFSLFLFYIPFPPLKQQHCFHTNSNLSF